MWWLDFSTFHVIRATKLQVPTLSQNQLDEFCRFSTKNIVHENFCKKIQHLIGGLRTLVMIAEEFDSKTRANLGTGIAQLWKSKWVR